MAGQPSTRRARRLSLGQHFLESERLVDRLVADAAVGPDDAVIDLGAGRGALTGALAARARTVVAVELDRALVDALVRRFATARNVVVLCADVCDVPLPRSPFRVVANPPWSCTAAVLHRLLDAPEAGLVRADLVLQWQVVRARAVGDDLLGAIWSPWWAFARGHRIPAALFRPAPTVDAAVLTITRRDPPLVAASHFGRYAEFVRTRWARRPVQFAATTWADEYRRGA